MPTYYKRLGRCKPLIFAEFINLASKRAPSEVRLMNTGGLDKNIEGACPPVERWFGLLPALY
jgi:hypothetical protein